MQQSKRQSGIEVVLNVGSGMFIACTATQLLAPVLDITISLYANLELTCILTTLSILRSYAWRRFFNRGADETR